MELRLGGYMSAFEDAGWSILVVCLISPTLVQISLRNLEETAG